MARSKTKKLIHRLDTVLSLIVRKQMPNCLFCGKPSDCAFHYITRAKYSIRWDFRNVVASCKGCNFRMEFDPAPFYWFFIMNNGLTAFDELIKDGNKTLKDSGFDYEEKLKELEAILAATERT